MKRNSQKKLRSGAESRPQIIFQGPEALAGLAATGAQQILASNAGDKQIASATRRVNPLTEQTPQQNTPSKSL